MLRAEAAAAPHDRMLAADRFAACDGLLGEQQEMLRGGSAVGGHARPDLGGECDSGVAPQRAHRQHHQLQHRQARQNRRREVGAGIIDGQAPRVGLLSLGMSPQLEEFLTIGDGEVAEAGAALIIGDAHERGGRQRERRVAGRE